ncbi:MAG: ankyrin repeat domain-containing protein, partial [Gammaproteobacteria bacterium]
PSDLVSVTADGQLIVLEQPAAGLMTATIYGRYTLFEGERAVARYEGEEFVTLTFLTSCSVRHGCDGFGIGTGGNENDRRANFAAMDLDTLKQFIASGADIDEYGGNARLMRFYLPYLIAAANKPAHVSLLISAGVDVNAKDDSGRTMLYYASANDDTPEFDNPAFDIMLALPGVDVNARANNNFTPLDNVANSQIANPQPYLEDHARQLRAAGGVCNVRAGNALFALCNIAPSRQSPNITLPNNANKTFIIRSPNINTPAVIGNLSTTPRQ